MRSEPQSSWPRALGSVQLAFASFVVLHLACQAYRAASESALGEPGVESRPWLVGTLLIAIWLPFAVCSGPALRASQSRARDSASAEDRALSLLEPVALGAVLLFTLLHALQLAWPLCTGALGPAELRGELIATLSSTRHGLPLLAIGYVFAVGAASFCASRQARSALPQATRGVTRAVVALGMLAYVFGSYAVIRCASGTLWP